MLRTDSITNMLRKSAIRIREITAVVLLMATSAQSARAQSVSPSSGVGPPRTSNDTAPSDLAKWNLICYCITSVGTPHPVVRADDNGQILYFARSGATRDQIASALHPPALSSQLILLRDWHLLAKSGESYKTAIPVIGPDKTAALRQRMGKVAEKIEPEVDSDIQKVSTTLAQHGLQGSLYSVVFSYILDGLLWTELDKSGVVHTVYSLKTTAEHPFWEGTFWALYPERAGLQPGTNTSGTDQITLMMTWTNLNLKKLNTLQNAPGLEVALKRIAAGDCRGLALEDTDHDRWEFGGANGICNMPVIRERSDDPIYAAGSHAGRVIAQALLEEDAHDIIGDAATREQSRLIAAHELIWEILNRLIRKHIVAEPAGLRIDNGTPSSLEPLLVVAVGGQ